MAKKTETPKIDTLSSRKARTEARKQKNREKNETQHRWNLEEMKSLGLTPRTYDREITRVVKRGRKTELQVRTVTKLYTPSKTLAQFHRRSLKKAPKQHVSA